jgi:hypothetical protein
MLKTAKALPDVGFNFTCSTRETIVPLKIFVLPLSLSYDLQDLTFMSMSSSQLADPCLERIVFKANWGKDKFHSPGIDS